MIFIKEKILVLLKTVLPSFLALALGGLSMLFSKVDYTSLNKPPLAPPGYIFAPVWILLYTLNAVSTYLFYRAVEGKNELRSRGLSINYIFLFLTVLWPIVFFVLDFKVASAVLIVFIYFVLISSIFFYYKGNRLSAYLLIPSAIWITIATYLNIGVAFLN